MVVFAAAGDNLQVNWPSVSSSVVSAGGTTINRDRSGNFVRESTWYAPPGGGGGGPSNGFEPIPTWQASLNGLLKGWRGTPDISFDANPASGVGVYDTNYPYSGWIQGYIGGTSLASPALAGIVNSAGNFYARGLVGQAYVPENALLYSELGGAVTYPADFNDINQGTPGTNVCGTSGQYRVQYGWDFCTGVGTPLTLVGK
jgi:subtilase family serine protease